LLSGVSLSNVEWSLDGRECVPSESPSDDDDDDDDDSSSDAGDDDSAVEGSEATRDLEDDGSEEADRTVTVTSEFDSTTEFTDAQTTDLEGQISKKILSLDLKKRIKKVFSKLGRRGRKRASRRRGLLQTYSYTSTSSIIAVSADAAAAAGTQFAEELTTEGFASVLEEAAAAAGIEATFEVTSAPQLASAGTASILGGALGLFAAAAAALL